MSLIGWMKRYFELDRGVVAGLVLRTWQIPAGFISLLVVVRCMTQEVQGYYYTFASLMGLQSFLELGLSVVILNHVSHQWAALRLDPHRAPTGDPDALSRLSGLTRLAVAYYGVMAAVFVVGVGTFGFFFLESPEVPSASWKGPWLLVVALNGLMFAAMPLLTILEGCGQVAEVQWARFAQAILGSFTLWTGLMLHWGLWACVAVGVTFVARDVWIVGIRWRPLIWKLLSPHFGATLVWRRDLLPMQWRLGLQGLLSYGMYSVFTPLMFKTHGAVVAGQMGMTWQIFSVIQMVGLAWIQARAPLLGRWVAVGDSERLKAEWRGLFRASTSAVAILSVLALMTIASVQQLSPRHGARFLALGPTALFLLANLAGHAIVVMAAFLRAHREEPTFLVGISTSIISSISTWVLGAHYGPGGAAWAYFLIHFLFALPVFAWVFRRYWLRHDGCNPAASFTRPGSSRGLS